MGRTNTRVDLLLPSWHDPVFPESEGSLLVRVGVWVATFLFEACPKTVVQLKVNSFTSASQRSVLPAAEGTQ